MQIGVASLQKITLNHKKSKMQPLTHFHQLAETIHAIAIIKFASYLNKFILQEVIVFHSVWHRQSIALHLSRGVSNIRVLGGGVVSPDDHVGHFVISNVKSGGDLRR